MIDPTEDLPRDFSLQFQALRQHYAQRVAEFGDSPEATQQSDRDTQERRMEVLSGVGDLASSKVLDFGCGTGHLLSYLQDKHEFSGQYVGYDLSPEMIEVAQDKHPDGRFEVRDILSDGLSEDFDYVLVSGTFNNDTGGNWDWVTAALKLLFTHTTRGLAFNALSTYVDYRDEGLYYVHPETVFRFCKEQLSPYVTLRHDYSVRDGVVPYEFTIYVYASGMSPRKQLS